MNFSYESLSDTIKVQISDVHRFGTDAFLLANFSGALHKDTVCDLGTGCGIIPMLLKRDFEPKQIYGVDIQPLAIEQLTNSIAESKIDNITPICADLKEIHKHLNQGGFDVVTCNPPYKAANAGIESEITAEKIARHEVMCDIYDVCKAASRLLRFSGRLCLCQRPERLADVIDAMKKADIEPKRLRFVAKRPSEAPWLFLIEGKKGAKPFLQVEPMLSVYADNGKDYSKELLKIYGNGKGFCVEG